jgi:serine phosphatase RsbU (regulator of sigma subunit)
MGLRAQSIEAKIAALTSLVLVLASTTLFLELAARERTKLIQAKATAARMVTQLLVTELSAAIDFGDADGVSARLNDLRDNPEIVAAGVWPLDTGRPSAQWSSPGAPALLPPRPEEADETTTSSDWLTTTSAVKGPDGNRLARARVIFTLSPENDAFKRSRLELLAFTGALALGTAALLALLARRFVVGPIRRLSSAAKALAEGDLTARVDLEARDEIGELARAFNIMGKAVEFREESLRKEIDLAQRIQTSILPTRFDVVSFAVSATMSPASEVGGDYYDVRAVKDGCWIGIGDVSGHGLDAGLMMLMTQSIVAALVERDPRASPGDVLSTLNDVLFDNIHDRLKRHEHATMTLLRYHLSGEVVFAGAHEEIIVYRADRKACEVVETPGTWIGGRRDVGPSMVNTTLKLAPGDVMLLHTDGATEVQNARGEQFGLERLCDEFARVQDRAPQAIVEHLRSTVHAWGEAKDDVTFVVGRFWPEGG